MICVLVRVSGRVQGVGYRYYISKNAREMGINGWIRNLPGGGVEAVLEGDQHKIGELLGLMKTGPVGSMVSGMELAELEPKNFDEFKITY